MSKYLGSTLISGVGRSTVRNAHTLLDFKWSDHIINSMEWLRADTFSWQNGDVYQAVYNHLVADISGKPLQSETVAGTTIQFCVADDGHKICPATQENNVSNIYNSTGIAWYYILDQENTRFKLPRSKHERYGNRAVIGNGMTLGMTDGTNNTGLAYNPNSNIGIDINPGLYGTNVGSTNVSGTPTARIQSMGISTDGTKSGIISTPTEDTNQYKYLYFYVGQFAQSAIEQTAGITSEQLNDKISKTDATDKAMVVGWGMPNYSSGVQLSNLSSYQQIIDDGYILVSGTGNGAWGDIGVNISTNGTTDTTFLNIPNMYGTYYLVPISKGTYIKAYGSTSRIIFYPCKRGL